MLASISSVASGKLRNSSEPCFLACKIKKKNECQDGLFLGFMIIICAIMSLPSIYPLSIYIPRSSVLIFGNLVFAVIFRM